MPDSVAPLELIWSMKSRQTVCKHASSVVRDCKKKNYLYYNILSLC